MFGSFSQQTQQQPSAFGSTGSFGGASTSTAPTGGGLFGNTGGAPPAPGITVQSPGATTSNPLFPPGGTASFGNSTTASSGTTGGSAFGSSGPSSSLFPPPTNTASSSTAGLFGGMGGGAPTTSSSAPAAGSNPNASGGLFGNSASTSAQQQPAAGTSSFGSTFGKPAGTGFGAAPTTGTTPAPSGGLFGGPPATSAFGANPGGATSAFGAAPAAAAPSSAFGSSTAAQSSFGGFAGGLGGGSGAPVGGASSSMFGAPAGSAPSAFGSSTLGGSTLGGSTLGGNNFGTSTMGASALGTSAGPPVPPDANSIEGQLAAVAAAITPGHPNNRFQYYFYNLVNPDQVHMFNSRPQNATNEALWIRANRENPNPSRLVPALAIGFEDLKKRADTQQLQVDGQVAAIRLLKQELEKLSTKHAMTILPLASRLVHAQAQIQSRLAALIHHLHLFIPALRGASLRPEEEVLRAKLEAIESEVLGRGAGGGGLGRAGGRLAELWGVVGRVKAAKEAGMGAGVDGAGSWAVVDQTAFDEIKQILIDEQQGLKYLTDILRTALRDIETVRSGFGSLDFASSGSGVP